MNFNCNLSSRLVFPDSGPSHRKLLTRQAFLAWARRIHAVILRCNTEIKRWRSFATALGYGPRAKNRPALKETQMSWKTPKIVEVPVGMEINMYACAARK